MKYELIEQEYEDKAKGSWAAERADTITDLTRGGSDVRVLRASI